MFGVCYSDTIGTMRMPNNIRVGATTAYRCECGEKFSFSRIEANNDATKRCKCGRTIVAYRGSIYGTRKG